MLDLPKLSQPLLNLKSKLYLFYIPETMKIVLECSTSKDFMIFNYDAQQNHRRAIPTYQITRKS